MRYARIDSGIVAELVDTDADIASLFPPELVWMPVTPDVAQGWTFDGKTFAAPVPLPFNPQDGALTELRARRDRLLDVISGMQADYIVSGDSANALLCRDVKVRLKAVTDDPTISGATSRSAFNAAAVTLWKSIAAPAPLEVRAEFARYATSA